LLDRRVKSRSAAVAQFGGSILELVGFTALRFGKQNHARMIENIGPPEPPAILAPPELPNGWVWLGIVRNRDEASL
jgi:hypothetical protein